MKNLIQGALAALYFCLFVASLEAQAVRWTLEDVVFDDDGSASGFFDFDPSSQMVLDWEIIVQGGIHASFPAFYYTPDNSVGDFYKTSDGSSVSFHIEPHSGREIRIESVGELDPEGGTAVIALGLDRASVECYNCSPYRLIVGGALVGAPRSGYTYHVPAFGAIPGNAGSQWNSTLQLINLGSGDNEISIRYYASGSDVTADTAITLSSRQTVTLDDLMATLGVEGIGSLQIESSTPIAGVARIYSIDAASGTVGQSFALTADESLMSVQESGLTALSGDTSRFRSNFGWYQVEAGEIEITFRRADGAFASSSRHVFGDHTYTQTAASNWLGSAIEDGMRITVRIIEGTGVGFVSDIDNLTNDPTTKPLIIVPGL